MTAFVLPNLDQSTIDELRKRIPDMSEFDVPRLEKVGKDVGKTADQALDRLLGRSRMSAWPWVAASVAIVAVIGAAAAWFTWWRRPDSTDTIVEEEIVSWQAPTAGSDLNSDLGSGLASDLSNDQSIDRSTSEAIGTFGEASADTYPAAER
jgi:hypothetical protein